MLASHSMLGITASVLMLQMVCIIRLRWRPCLCPHLVRGYNLQRSEISVELKLPFKWNSRLKSLPEFQGPAIQLNLCGSNILTIIRNMH
uniref:Uncharacterized protein n=1 Tax=Cucumis sativus TaxID=3659 RepID=A0A0A0LF24_CUCSA